MTSTQNSAFKHVLTITDYAIETMEQEIARLEQILSDLEHDHRQYLTDRVQQQQIFDELEKERILYQDYHLRNVHGTDKETSVQQQINVIQAKQTKAEMYINRLNRDIQKAQRDEQQYIDQLIAACNRFDALQKRRQQAAKKTSPKRSPRRRAKA